MKKEESCNHSFFLFFVRKPRDIQRYSRLYSSIWHSLSPSCSLFPVLALKRIPCMSRDTNPNYIFFDFFVLKQLFGSPNKETYVSKHPNRKNKINPFCASIVPDISIDQYFKCTAKYSKCSSEVLLNALNHINRSVSHDRLVTYPNNNNSICCHWWSDILSCSSLSSSSHSLTPSSRKHRYLLPHYSSSSDIIIYLSFFILSNLKSQLGYLIVLTFNLYLPESLFYFISLYY